MKIALCYYGNVGWRYGEGGVRQDVDPAECFPSVERHIIKKNAHVDIFVHSWSVEHKQDILATVKPLSYLIEPQRQFPQSTQYSSPRGGIADLKSAVLRKARLLSSPDFALEEAGNLQRVYSRWYSTKKVLELKRQQEVETNARYDFVMLIRFDLEFYTDICFDRFDNRYFHAGDPSDLNRLRHNYFVKENVSAYKNKHMSVRGKPLFRLMREKLGMRKTIFWVQPKWHLAPLCALGLEHYNISDTWFFSCSEIMDELGTLYEHVTDYNSSPHISSYRHIVKKIGTSALRFPFQQFIDFELRRCSTDLNIECVLH